MTSVCISHLAQFAVKPEHYGCCVLGTRLGFTECLAEIAHESGLIPGVDVAVHQLEQRLRDDVDLRPVTPHIR